MGEIWQSISFSSLDQSGQETVRAASPANEKSSEEKLQFDTLEVFRERKSLVVSINYYSNKLTKINSASFKYLSQVQQEVLMEELLFTFYLLSAQHHLDEIANQRQEFTELEKKIKRCSHLIHELRKQGQPKTVETDVNDASAESGGPLKYLGLTVIAPLIAQKMLEITGIKNTEPGSSRTDALKESMTAVNVRRLYWVWSGGLLATVISLLPDDFANKSQIQTAVSAPSPYTGYMSWMLYYTRFGINLSLLLKHTIRTPWMSEEEAKIPVYERFKTQWDQRKFVLLNDSIWATANMACFFWLTGAGTLGYYGNVLTAGLLLMDVVLTIWRFWEEETQYNLDKNRYATELNKLREQITLSTDEDKTKILQEQLISLEKAKDQCDFNWKYKRFGLINDLVYAAGLLAAFAVVCSFFVTVSPPVAILYGVIGAALCFVLTVAYPAVGSLIELSKSKALNLAAKQEAEKLLQQFGMSEEDGQKRLYFLDMKQLMADSHFQEQSIRFQKIALLRAILVDIATPPFIFAAFMFLPLGSGVGLLAAGFALAACSYHLLAQYEPKEVELNGFNENEYADFQANPTLATLKGKNSSSQKLGFFTKYIQEGTPFSQETPQLGADGQSLA